MTIPVDPVTLHTVDEQALNPGDVIFPRARQHVGPAIVCRHAEDQYATRFVLLNVSGVLVVSPFENVERDGDHVRIAEAKDLRIRFSDPVRTPDLYDSPISPLGIDADGAFLAVTRDGRPANRAVVDLREWRRKHPANRLDECGVWFSTWQLVHIDQWGREEIVLASAIAAT